MVSQEQNRETIAGVIDRFLFQSNENGFSIAVLAIEQNTVVIKGYLPDLQAGQEVTLFGEWTTHPKYGKQFNVASYSLQLPTSLTGLKKYLGSGLIKGIGPVYAEKLLAKFGTAVPEIIENEPTRLQQVEGIGPKRLAQIVASWQQQKDISNIIMFLQEKGVSTAYAIKIYKCYGNSASAVIQENPYRLADDIWGIGFRTADQIAKNLGLPHDSPKRIRSGIIFALTTTLGHGHVYSELEELKKTIYELLELTHAEHGANIKQAFYELYEGGKIKLIKHDDKHFVTLAAQYLSELGTAKKIKELIAKPPSLQFNLDHVYQQISTQAYGQIELNQQQQQAVMAALQHKIAVVTGGPGTGKTTLIKTLLSILDNHNVLYQLAAPTGRAAKRISEGTGKFAATIHRLLEFDVSTMRFTRNESNTLELQFLIIDEASMIDLFLAYALVRALPPHAHILFIGDIDQLPSVGSGNVLGDLIASKMIPCIRLTEIFRQAQDSLIVVNAHRINRGEFPTMTPIGEKKDFYFIREEDPHNITKHLAAIYKQKLGMHKISPQQSIVLSPMHKGSAGTQRLNSAIQQMLNPHNNDDCITHTGITYKLHDRVMQLRNNYDKGVFNGDIGTIIEIVTKDKQLHAQFDNKIVIYEFSDLDELTLAYALSIHKSQGSEYDAVIVPIFTQHFTLLQRNLLYTAITRAKRLCILIGQPKAIAIAVRNNKTALRKTFLQEQLTGNVEVL